MLEFTNDSVIALSVFTSNCTGIEQSDPKRAVIALEMLCNGSGYKDVMTATGMKFDQLLGLRTRHEIAIETRRKQLAIDGFEMAEGLRLLVKEKMSSLSGDAEAMAKVNIRDLVMSYGIVQEKGLMAAEGNRSIVKNDTKRPSLADAAAAIEEAKIVSEENRKELQKESIPIEAIPT